MHNRPQTLQQIASELRASLTPSEAALWQCIRACRTGVWFRRQVVIGRFIVDFVAPSARLVVEVDGGYHARRVSADARRDRVLRRLGYRVLRLDAVLVLTQPQEAVARIRAAFPPR
jgi:very-short-patch-repair endonuclease